ncbi:ABC transporter ATP-binding protein [Cryobacterium sp. HLT2-28]|uniref:ABC transporter ATP-binding protein n=1 Tax=Cryobacterium sp. HLT2-28 TaxID=1259146 RepID=UPI00106A3FB6|nr:ABC transporter ATP-binding protein [Cryobacterium sp. HLT2-28]TFB94004.1 ABC transporter ATP-binding protein [Cryobacterium sp. HLT2-28]
MDAPVIQVREFRKVYRGFVAVDGISFDVHRGEVFGLLGPNGAGKTTTLESLEGLRRPDGGTLRIAGVDPTRAGRRLSALIGVQLQASALPDSFRVGEAMRFFCAYHGIAPRMDLIDRVGLGDRSAAQYHELSGGQQRRLALALAVAHDPAVLILDEPTSGLDVASRAMLHELIRELQAAGTTVLLATHDMAEASELATRVAILLRGAIAATGTPLELTAAGEGLTRVSVRTERDSLGRPGTVFPFVSRSSRLGDYTVYFSTDVGPTVSAVIAYLAVQSDPLVDLRVERPSLEDRFLEITTEGATR